MDYVPIVLVAIPAMTGVLWAGSTGAMANLRGEPAGKIFPFQILARKRSRYLPSGSLSGVVLK